MSVVYLARDTTGRLSAIKVLKKQYTEENEHIERFFTRQIKLTKDLDHPNIVKLIDYGKKDDTYFLVYELIQGLSLDAYLKKNRPTISQIEKISLSILKGLSYAHNMGLVHRDIKPQNILITQDGKVKITDFGIARALSSTTITQTGMFIGSPGYVSPEQADGKKIGTTSDLYSFGILLFEMLSKKLPFTSDTPWGIVNKHINEAPPDISKIVKDIPSYLSYIVDKCLVKSPQGRFSSADEIIGVLRDRSFASETIIRDFKSDETQKDNKVTPLLKKKSSDMKKVWIAIGVMVSFIIVISIIIGLTTSRENKQTISNNVAEEPSIDLKIIYGPEEINGMCVYRVEAEITGYPESSIEFNKDDSNGNWGKNIAQVNLTRDIKEFILKVSVTNRNGVITEEITLDNILIEVDESEVVTEEATKEIIFDEPVTITFTTWNPEIEFLAETLDAFSKDYPNITVEANTLAYADYMPLLKSSFVSLTDYMPLLKSSFAAGTATDIILFHSGIMVSEFLDYLIPLAPYCEAEWGKNWRDLFYDNCKEQVELAGEEYYLLPYSWASTGTWANVRLLEEYGLSIPENIEDLENIRDTLRPNGLSTLFSGYQNNWPAMYTFQFFMDEFCPGLFYEAEAGNTNFNDPGFIEALEMWKYFFDAEIIQPGAYNINTYMDVVNPFVEGKNGALLVNGSWFLDGIYTNQFDFEAPQIGGFSPIKFPDLNGDGVKPRSTVSVAGWGIYNGIENEYKRVACWEFVKYITIDEGAKLYANRFDSFPAFKAVQINDAVYEKAGDAKEEFKASVQWYFDNPGSQGAIATKYDELRDGLFEILAAVASGIQTPEEAAAYMQKISESIER